MRASEKGCVDPSAAPALYGVLKKIKKGQITSLLYDTSGYPLAPGEHERETESGPSVLTAIEQNIAPLFVSQRQGVMDVV